MLTVGLGMEGLKRNWFHICHKVSNVLCGKRSIVVNKYCTVWLFSATNAVNNPLDSFCPLIWILDSPSMDSPKIIVKKSAQPMYITKDIN